VSTLGCTIADARDIYRMEFEVFQSLLELLEHLFWVDTPGYNTA